MNVPPHRASPPPGVSAFTLVEMIVSMAVLAIIMIMVSQLFNSATTLTTGGNKHMDTDSQARAVFDRMAIDFAQMVRRPDVDYYLKEPNNTCLASGAIPGNDQIAFFSQVPGYYSGPGAASPVSLVAYRINADTSASNPYFNQMQRYGYGLAWNGTNPMAIVFSGSSTSSGNNTIMSNWPNAVTMVADPNYESIGPEVFRMEYCYVLKGAISGTASIPASVSDTPWNTDPLVNHKSVNGLQDVAAIAMTIAVIDPKSRAIVTNSQLNNLAAKMIDFSGTMKPGDLEYNWQSAVADPTNGIPRAAASAIRVYSRNFHLPQTLSP